jgi:hypothetical protein
LIVIAKLSKSIEASAVLTSACPVSDEKLVAIGDRHRIYRCKFCAVEVYIAPPITKS